jgi:hypothetical protein
MRWLLLAFAACAHVHDACETRVPAGAPVAVAYAWDMSGDRIDVALWPSGEIVFRDGPAAVRAWIDPARAREVIANVASQLARVPPYTELTDETDHDTVLLAIRTRDGYRVVEVYGYTLGDHDRMPRDFEAAYVALLSMRPAHGTVLRLGFEGEAAITDVLACPGGAHRVR